MQALEHYSPEETGVSMDDAIKNHQFAYHAANALSDVIFEQLLYRTLKFPARFLVTVDPSGESIVESLTHCGAAV